MWEIDADDSIYFVNSCFGVIDNEYQPKYFAYFKSLADSRYVLFFESLYDDTFFHRHINIVDVHNVFRTKDVVSIAKELKKEKLSLYYIPLSITKDNKDELIQIFKERSQKLYEQQYNNLTEHN